MGLLPQVGSVPTVCHSQERVPSQVDDVQTMHSNEGPSSSLSANSGSSSDSQIYHADLQECTSMNVDPRAQKRRGPLLNVSDTCTNYK